MISWGSDLDRFRNKMVVARKRVPLESKKDVEIWGRTVEAKVKANAPVDLGALRASISYEPIDGGNGAKVTANVPYAAFIEFGTGAGVLIPPGWEEVAARFKGSGERKVTLQPQPYLIPAFDTEVPNLLNRLQARLRNLFA